MARAAGFAAGGNVRSLSAIALIAVLSACGQKGPLYLPDAGDVVVRPAQTAEPQQPSQSPAPETPVEPAPAKKKPTP